jgi:hypothetical protein
MKVWVFAGIFTLLGLAVGYTLAATARGQGGWTVSDVLGRGVPTLLVTALVWALFRSRGRRTLAAWALVSGLGVVAIYLGYALALGLRAAP